MLHLHSWKRSIATVPRRTGTYGCVRSEKQRWVDQVNESMTHSLKIQDKRYNKTANEAVGQTPSSAELASRAAFGNIYSFSFPTTNVLLFCCFSEQRRRETLDQRSVFLQLTDIILNHLLICPQPRLANLQREKWSFCRLQNVSAGAEEVSSTMLRHNDLIGRGGKRLNMDSSRTDRNTDRQVDRHKVHSETLIPTAEDPNPLLQQSGNQRQRFPAQLCQK